MKIINEGIEITKLIRMQREGWWIGVTVSCYNCKFEGQLEVADEFKINKPYFTSTRHGRGGYYTIELNCPKCGQEIRRSVCKFTVHQRRRWAEKITDLENIPPFVFVEEERPPLTPKKKSLWQKSIEFIKTPPPPSSPSQSP